MVNISEILSFGWPKQVFSLNGSRKQDGREVMYDFTSSEDFNEALIWSDANPLPKPSLQEVELVRAEAERMYERRTLQKQAEQKFHEEKNLVKTLSLFAKAIQELQQSKTSVATAEEIAGLVVFLDGLEKYGLKA